MKSIDHSIPEGFFIAGFKIGQEILDAAQADNVQSRE